MIYTWAAQTLSLLTFAIGKVSIALFLLLRVIGVTKNVWTKVFLYSVITSLLAINSATIIMVYAQCRPVQKLFNPDYPGHCFSAKITTGFARFGGGTLKMPPGNLERALNLFSLVCYYRRRSRGFCRLDRLETTYRLAEEVSPVVFAWTGHIVSQSSRELQAKLP